MEKYKYLFVGAAVVAIIIFVLLIVLATAEDKCYKEYPAGTVVILTATPCSDSYFAGWEGDCTGNSPVCKVVITGKMNVKAKFNLKPGKVRDLRISGCENTFMMAVSK